MCLKPEPIDMVPEETARIARAAYPKGNIYLQLRDEFGTIYQDEQFVALYPRKGQPGEAPWRLALVSVMQFREGLSDRQAADAVRGRLDWKYLLGLELSDPGFDASVLSEFRQRLLTPERILIGKHGNRAVLRHRTSTLIGNMSVLPAQQARSGTVGRQSRIGGATRSSRLNLPCRIVVAVLCVSSAHTRSQLRPVGFSRSVPNLSIRPYKPHANGKLPRSLKRHTTSVPGSRGHSRRAFALSSYGGQGIAAWPKSICSRSSLLPRSTSAAFLPGTLSKSELKHGKLPLSGWSKKWLKEMSF